VIAVAQFIGCSTELTKHDHGLLSLLSGPIMNYVCGVLAWQIKELLARLDADKSGSIRFEEFKNLVKAEGYPTITAYTAHTLS